MEPGFFLQQGNRVRSQAEVERAAERYQPGAPQNHQTEYGKPTPEGEHHLIQKPARKEEPGSDKACGCQRQPPHGAIPQGQILLSLGGANRPSLRNMRTSAITT